MKNLTAVLLISTGISTTVGQAVSNVPPQRFEVASIKPCAPGDMSSGARGGSAGATFINSPGSTIINCVSAAHLINRAFIMYGAQAANDPINAWTGVNGIGFSRPMGEPLKIRGGPAWVYTDNFSIEAKAAGGADAKTMMGSMLRSLLEDRFRLTLHQQTEEAPMWALSVARGGPKFKPAEPGGCIPIEVGKNMQEAKTANPGKPFCGRFIGDAKPPIVSWRLSNVPVAELAAVLGLGGMALGLPVIDQTGLTGMFNFAFEYERDQTSPESAISSAVQSQLGLKLEKIKGRRGFLVIDQIERPTPNDPAPVWGGGR